MIFFNLRYIIFFQNFSKNTKIFYNITYISLKCQLSNSEADKLKLFRRVDLLKVVISETGWPEGVISCGQQQILSDRS
jgi:hypothetical protein